MRYSSVLIVAAITICESLAGPTHLHRHAKAHAKKDVIDWAALDWEKMDIDWTAAWAAGQKTATPSAAVVETAPTVAPIIAAQKIKATTTAAVEAPASTSEPPKAASSSTVANTPKASSDASTAFSSIVGLANKLTAFGTATKGSGSIVGKVGNIGSPQGSNMIKVDAVGDYKYTNTFVNTAGEDITVIIWNKSFERNGVVEANLGAMVAPVTPALSITLGPGESQVVAFQEDTQAGWAQATTDIHISGSYATTWGEINYISTGCGYDVSAIMNKHGNTYKMDITALETTCLSNMDNNLWIARNGNPEDPIPIGSSDGSCFITAGKCTVTTKMGGQQ